MNVLRTTLTSVRRHALALAAIGLLALAGCSGPSNGSTAPTTGSSAAGSSSTTVSVREVGGHQGVLTAPDGKTLYFSDQEIGTVLCKSRSCTEIWAPLTIPKGSSPTGPDQLGSRLATLPRPDGAVQVALDHRPLYTFSLDGGPGQLGGDGQHDNFDSTAFTWRVATTAGAKAPAPAPSTSAGNGYGY